MAETASKDSGKGSDTRQLLTRVPAKLYMAVVKAHHEAVNAWLTNRVGERPTIGGLVERALRKHLGVK
jgi:predicted membrane-bound mannosyltransferase